MTFVQLKRWLRASRRSGVLLAGISLVCVGCVFDGETAEGDSLTLVNESPADLVVVRAHEDSSWQEALLGAPTSSAAVLRPGQSTSATWERNGPGSDTYCLPNMRRLYVLKPNVPVESRDRNTVALRDGYSPEQFSLRETYDSTSLCATEARHTHSLG